MSTKNAAASRASQLAAKSTEIKYAEVKNPPAAENFETAFKKATGMKHGIANQFIINVLPNFLPLLLYIIYHVQQHIRNMEPRDHAKVSAPTFVAYCLGLIYAHFLLSDAFIRPNSSHYAEELKNSTKHREFMDFLLQLPVPDFLTPIIKYFTTATTPRRTNVWFAASAAGFNHFVHFGRFFPINLFTAMHDIAATSNARTDPQVIYRDLHLTEIFNIDAYYTLGAPFTAYFHNFFASLISYNSDTNLTSDHFLSNKVNQVIRSLFNPVLLRSMQQKQAFTEIALSPPTFPNPNYNPYVAMLCMTKENLPELRTVFESIADVMNGTVPCKSDLAGLYKDYSGVSILVHGYSVYGLPTWDLTKSRLDTDRRETKVKPLSDAKFAEYLKFKTTFRNISWTDRTYTYPTSTITQNPADATSTATTDIGDPRLLLLEDRNGPTDYNQYVPGPTRFRPYDTEIDLYPMVKLLNFNEEDTVNAWMTTLCGMIIESDDLSGSTVTHPHPTTRVEEDNAIFLNSAIPFSQTVLATSFSTSNPNPTIVAKVDRPSYFNPISSNFVRFLNKIFLPYRTKTVKERGTEVIAGGLTPLAHTNVPSLVQTFLGMTIRNKPTVAFNEHEHAPSDTPPNSLLLWSPYTFVSNAYEDDWDNTTPEVGLRDIYFLSNLRTIFGTDVTLMEVNSPLYAMPVA